MPKGTAAVYLLTILALFSLSYTYQNYLSFSRFDTFITTATLVKQEARSAKNGSPYFRLTFQKGSLHFTSSSFLPLKDLRGYRLKLELSTRGITFLDYLRGFYTKTTLLGRSHRPTLRFRMAQSIQGSHTNPTIGTLYSALFLATPIDKTVRQKLSMLGVNHLAALSGFHLGFLALIIALLIKYPYGYIHTYYAPHRHQLRDLMFITLILLGIYLYFLDFSPSLTRAYVMLFLGFLFFDRGVPLLSVKLLMLTILSVIVLFPSMLFSLGFWLSCLGVLAIFILLRHYAHLDKIRLAFLINIAVFLLMLPYSLYFFGNFSWGQLFSPLLSLLFMFFYPFMILLHLIGLPDLLDGMLVKLFSMDFHLFHMELSTLFISLYTILLITSVRFKSAFYMSLLSTAGVLIAA